MWDTCPVPITRTVEAIDPEIFAVLNSNHSLVPCFMLEACWVVQVFRTRTICWSMLLTWISSEIFFLRPGPLTLETSAIVIGLGVDDWTSNEAGVNFGLGLRAARALSALGFRRLEDPTPGRLLADPALSRITGVWALVASASRRLGKRVRCSDSSSWRTCLTSEPVRSRTFLSVVLLVCASLYKVLISSRYVENSAKLDCAVGTGVSILETWYTLTYYNNKYWVDQHFVETELNLRYEGVGSSNAWSRGLKELARRTRPKLTPASLLVLSSTPSPITIEVNGPGRRKKSVDFQL